LAVWIIVALPCSAQTSARSARKGNLNGRPVGHRTRHQFSLRRSPRMRAFFPLARFITLVKGRRLASQLRGLHHGRGALKQRQRARCTGCGNKGATIRRPLANPDSSRRESIFANSRTDLARRRMPR
jgi:hypothetical protein